MPKLICAKQNKIYILRSGTELLQAYKIDPSIPLKFGCCNGECGVCAIKILEGQENLSGKSKQEKFTLTKNKLDPSFRLACLCALIDDVVADI